jgi:carnitine O-acetyltransferase
MMPPMGMRPQVRQGTSHLVPIVVSAGLAVGVFCGLLFGLGIKHDVTEPSKASNNAKASEEVQTAQPSMGVKITPTPTTPAPTKPAAGSGSAAGDAVAAGGGSAAGSAAPAQPRPGKLSVEVQPDTAAAGAKVLVDGKPITGKVAEIPFAAGEPTKKVVKVVVQVRGYKDIEKTIDVESDAESSISFDLKGVRPAAADASAAPAGGTPAASPPKDAAPKDAAPKDAAPKNPPPKKGNGKGSGKGNGLIDI